jgi:Tol biopolymer transport system component
MKTKIICLVMILCAFNAISIFALSEKYGTNISSKLPEIAELKTTPIWSPDGTWIAVTAFATNMIWIIPAVGGDPISIADYTHSTVYKGYELMSFGSPRLIAFTPDSQEILFSTGIIDESRGTKVTITDTIDQNGNRRFGWEVYGSIMVIKAVNIYTGMTRTVMDSAVYGIYSHNGKYFVYNSESDGSLVLYEMETGKSQKVATFGYPACFSHDDSYFIYRTLSKEVNWITMPLNAGKSETVISGFTSVPSFSFDDRFVLHQIVRNQNTLLQTLAVYDRTTGKDMFVLPEEADISCSQGSFSPDGKKFCYVLESIASPRWSQVYVRDFNPADYTTITSVDIAKPLEFALQGNYPNPFNPSTSIQFSLATAGKVNLSIYNVAGQKIRELVSNTEMTPGIHRVLWDGHDDLGKPVSSGIYLSRLETGGKAVAGRMLLVK